MVSSTLARFVIDNSNGGAIALSPAIQVTANDIMTGGDFSAYIDTANNGAPASDSGGTVRIDRSEIFISAAGSMFSARSFPMAMSMPRRSPLLTSTRKVVADIHAWLGGITRFAVRGETAPDVLHTLTARFVTSDGGINFDGTDARFLPPATNGGASRSTRTRYPSTWKATSAEA